MPIYEYECSECAKKFELRRSFNDESQVYCPDCKCEATRIFSPVPIIFKGSGFYTTDYRSNHGHSAPASASEESKPSETKDTSTATAGTDD